ncbi:MAG: histidine kinase [Nostoc sp.]
MGAGKVGEQGAREKSFSLRPPHPAPLPLFNAQCPMPNAPCPIPNPF